jgi:hypothetical protein
LTLVFERLPFLTVGLPALRPKAASGVISIVNDSKQAMNTLRLLGAGLGDNFMTNDFIFKTRRLLPGYNSVTLKGDSALTGKRKIPFDERQD